MSCGGVGIFISHLFLVKLFTKTCFVLKHQLVVDIHLCPHHWSVCQSIKSCKYKKRLRCTWIFKGTKGHCASEMSYSRHQHTDRVGLKFTPLTPKSNTLIMRPQNFSQWNLTFSNQRLMTCTFTQKNYLLANLSNIFYFSLKPWFNTTKVSIEIVIKEDRAFSSFALAHYFASRTNWVQKQTFKHIFTPDGSFFHTVEPVLSDHPVLSSQLSKSPICLPSIMVIFTSNE